MQRLGHSHRARRFWFKGDIFHPMWSTHLARPTLWIFACVLRVTAWRSGRLALMVKTAVALPTTTRQTGSIALETSLPWVISEAGIRGQGANYDKLSRLVTVRAPAGDASTATTAFEYDSWGNRTRVTDPLSKVTGFLYDKEDRLTKVTDALSGETEYAYDLRDNLTKVIDAKDQATEYEYDVRGRLTREVPPYGPPTGRFGTEYLYAQTMSPILTKLRKPNLWNGSSVEFREIVYQYDQMNRLTKMQGPGNEFGMYGYDVNSRMVWGFDETYGTTVSGNDYVAGWQFDYDAEGRLTDELLYTTGTATGYVLGERSVKYDKAGRRTAQRFVSANQPGHLNLDTTQTYTYDATKKWLTQIQRGSSATEKAQCVRDEATRQATKMS